MYLLFGNGRRVMHPPKCKLTEEEIRRAFQGLSGEAFPPILSPIQLAQLSGLSVKTIYEWIAKGSTRRRLPQAR